MRAVSVLLAASAFAAPAFASLASFRATIPGSLHQCESTTVFFFDSANERPVTLVFAPQASAPTGETTLDETLASGVYQVIEGITTPDAQQYSYTLAIAEGESFATLAFFADGSGKNLNLDRSVQAPLPGASACNPATAASVSAGSSSSSSSTQTSSGAAGADSAAAGSTSLPSTAVSAASSASSLATSVRSSASSLASSASSAASSAASAGASSGGNTSGATTLVGSALAFAAAGAIAFVGAAI
ncbi:hypothetical protein JCM10213_001006 [Rhodosporidiobolus nylandii]